MNSESILNNNLESLVSNLSSILCTENYENQDNSIEIDPLQAERYDNPTYELSIMMKNCGIDYGTFPNSHAVMETNFSYSQGNEDAMTHAPHFNFKNQMNGLRPLTNAYGYDHDNLCHFAGNNILKKNEVHYLNFNLKKIIKSRIHSKKQKFQKPQTKPRTTIENYLSLKGPSIAIDMKRTGIIQISKLQNISDSKLVQNAVQDWSFFLSRLSNDRKVVERDFFQYHVDKEEVLDFSVVNRSKSLDLTIAVIINKTLEESVHGSNLLSFMHKYCKDHGIMVEESHDDYWQDVGDALKKLRDQQISITTVNTMQNMTNLNGNFYNKAVGIMWMDSLNKLIDGIKKLVTYLWMLQVMIKSRNNSEVQK